MWCRYKIPESCRLDMDEKDMKEARTLLASDFIMKNPEWVKEIEIMLKMKKKAEIQALSSFGFQYLTEECVCSLEFVHVFASASTDID